ncbi:response regulator transcription factor [Dermabacteraceae bacterium P13101]
MPSPSGDKPRVLVVDDDATVRGVVADYLRAAEIAVTQSGDGNAALREALTGNYDAIVLDLMLPGIDGKEIFSRLRAAGVDSSVIMLTALGEESDRIAGLELGADDYLAKPFSPRELVLRVRAVLRRASAQNPASVQEKTREILTDGDLTLDTTAGNATRGGKELALTSREYELLEYLVKHPNEVFSREDLMAAVWGSGYGDHSTVTVHVRRVRGKIEADPSAPTRLVTVWGRGYRWEPRAGGCDD